MQFKAYSNVLGRTCSSRLIRKYWAGRVEQGLFISNGHDVLFKAYSYGLGRTCSSRLLLMYWAGRAVQGLFVSIGQDVSFKAYSYVFLY